MGEIVAINQIDDTIYNNGELGIMTQRLASIYQDLTKNEGYQIVW